MDEKTAISVMDAEKQAVPEQAASKPWFKRPWVLAGLGLLLVAVIAIPTAVVVTNNSKNSSMSSSTDSETGPTPLPPSGSTNTNTTNPGAVADDDDSIPTPGAAAPADILICRRQDNTRLNITFAEAGVTASTVAAIEREGASSYPREPVRIQGTTRQLDYAPAGPGPFASSPMCQRPSAPAPGGSQSFQPFLPCVLTADPVDLQNNYYLTRSAATSGPFAASLTTLYDDAEDAVEDDHVYTITKKTVFPPVQNPQDPHAYYNPAPYYFPDPTCVDPITGQKNKTACPYVHCAGSIQNPDNRQVRDSRELAGMIHAVTALAHRAYFAGAEFRIRGPNANSTVYSRPKSSYTFNVANEGSAGVLVTPRSSVADDQTRYLNKAQEILSTFFLSPKTFMRPSFMFAGHAHGYPMEGAFFSGFTDFVELVDAIILLESLSAWNVTSAGVDGQSGLEISTGLRKWFYDLYAWHLEEDGTWKDQARINNIGSWVDAVWVSVAHYGGYPAAPKGILDLVPARRIVVQIAPSGEMIRETTRGNSYGYTTFAVRALATMALQADRYAASASSSDSSKGSGGLWTWFDSKSTSNSSSIQRAVDFSLPYIVGLETSKNSNISNLTGNAFEIVDRPWPFPQDKTRDTLGIEYVRQIYFALGGSASEEKSVVGESTRRYRVAWEEGKGIPFADWDDVRRLGEPAQ